MTKEDERAPMARRKRTSLLEDLYQISAAVPWWAGVLLALLSYAALHWLSLGEVPKAGCPGPGRRPPFARGGALVRGRSAHSYAASFAAASGGESWLCVVWSWC